MSSSDLTRRIRSRIPLRQGQGTKFTITAVLLVLLIGVSFSLGYLFRDFSSPEYFQFPITRDVFNLVKEKGIKKLPDGPVLQYGMIHGMLQAYNDPYTVFVEPPQAELQSNQLEGKFGGIGIRLEQDFRVKFSYTRCLTSPALKAGILDGDRLLSVNQLTITAQTTLDQIQAEIRGPIGQAVKIKVSRSSTSKSIEVSMTRTEVPVPSVTFNLASFDESLGVIQLNIVADSSSKEIVNAVDQLQQAGATRFIFDLRNNGGGLVDFGADIVRLFLRQGVFLEEQFKGQKPFSFGVSSPGALADIPMVIVVNENTASAAEIIAGALQHAGRSKLVGTRTYGKDLVQQVFSLSDGSSLHVTAGRWWLPDNENGIGADGLIPDQLLTSEETNSAAALEEAARFLVRP